MGEQSSGKSSVVEGFVGQKFNFISDGIATKIPLILSLLSDPFVSQPKWELRIDGEWKEMSIDEVKQHVSLLNGKKERKKETISIFFSRFVSFFILFIYFLISYTF